MHEKIKQWVGWLRYRVGVKYSLFFLLYVSVLIIILLVIRDQMTQDNNFFYALPAIIIGYDRLFSIIRKGLNYGLKRLDNQKAAEATVAKAETDFTFATLIVKVFYFWQQSWQQLRQEKAYWANWAKVRNDFEAVLNNDSAKVAKKFALDPQFLQFQEQTQSEYYFVSFEQRLLKMRKLAAQKAYQELAIAHNEFEQAIRDVQRIFEILFMWVTSIQNQLIPVAERSEQKQTYFEFVNTTLKGLILNNFLGAARDLVEKKYAKYI